MTEGHEWTMESVRDLAEWRCVKCGGRLRMWHGRAPTRGEDAWDGYLYGSCEELTARSVLES